MAANLVQTSIQPAAQDTSALYKVFQSITPESCPHVFNFHIHTLTSDGRLHPEQVIKQAIAIGLQGFAITDHHSVDGYRQAQQYLGFQRQQTNGRAQLPHLWTGVEINADLIGSDVHILCYAFNPDHEALQPYLQGISVTGAAYQAEAVIQAVHAAGGLAILAHPARYRRSPVDLIAAAADQGIDGIEAYYAYDNPSPWRPSPRQTAEVYQLGQTYGLLNTCGTDTHGINLLQRL